MSDAAYCRDKVALPGSSLYYSLLFVDPRRRAALTAVHALADEFREIVDTCRDQQVARAKLGWWAEEIARAGRGEARHPVARALSEPVRHSGAGVQPIMTALEASSERLSVHGFTRLAELESHYARLAGIDGCLAAAICGYRDTRTLAAARMLGTGLALAALARRPGPRGSRPATDGAEHYSGDVPAEVLAAAGATPADLLAATTSAALKQAIAVIARRASACLRESVAQTPACDRAAQACRLALAAIELAQLRALERAGYAALERARGVTPLRKLWIAWNHRIQE